MDHSELLIQVARLYFCRHVLGGIIKQDIFLDKVAL